MIEGDEKTMKISSSGSLEERNLLILTNEKSLGNY
jgi:hypothetical protein